MVEEWRPYPKNTDYQVSNLGQVKSKYNKILKQCEGRGGYFAVNIHFADGKHTKAYVHRMVLETFQPIENSEKMLVDHINGKIVDNSLENLRWATPQENVVYRIENRAEINQEIIRLTSKYGYEKTLEILQNIE